MFSDIFSPKFTDTDALGHINNTNVPVWFEGGRDPIFRFFIPNLDPKQWCLILAKIDVTFHAQMHYGKEMEVKTYVSRIGSSSFDVSPRALAKQYKMRFWHFSYGSFFFSRTKISSYSRKYKSLITNSFH